MSTSYKPVNLRSEKSDLFHCILEIALGKWQWLKNKPRGNYLVLKTLWLTFMPVIVSFLLYLLLWKIESHYRSLPFSNFGATSIQNGILTFRNYKLYFLPLLAVNVVIYWNLWKDFHSKWEYACSLYNSVISSTDEKIQKSLRIALAIDLLTLDLWAHRSFAEFFWIVLTNALKELGHESELLRLSRGEMTEDQAMKYLEEYQKHFFKNSKET